MEFDLYKDIQKRTGGDIYIGVVGPVRTGKSTFIKRFMELFVLPYMEDDGQRERAQDELPQAAQGKTIMTSEPKFIPQEAAEISLCDGCNLKVRLIDSVGYMVDGASGHMEGDNLRMIQTPWFEQEVPFAKAAEVGTNKVIREHSTIGIVLTTDGSIGDIPGKNYEQALEKSIEEMVHIGKPFLIVLNSTHPVSEQTITYAKQLQDKYGYTVLPLNVMQMQKEDVLAILNGILLEFPVSQIQFFTPGWTDTLELSHPVREELIRVARKLHTQFEKMKDVLLWKKESPQMSEILSEIEIRQTDLSDGMVTVKMEMDDSYYYDYISQMAGISISNDCELIAIMQNLTESKNEYERIRDALEAVWQKGYGVVMPQLKDFTVEDPQLITHGNRYGVKLHAFSPSIHLIKTEVETEIAPIVGSREQAEDLISYIEEAKKSEEGMWNTNIFGKSIGELMEEGMRSKILLMDETCQQNLQDSMQKIVNESTGGMICIII